MLRKRIIGVVTVKNGWAVQSFGYKNYLPLGKVSCIVENLDRWGVDEILLQVVDRSSDHLSPDFELLESIGELGISTPLCYAGGIRSVDDAVNVIQKGGDRVCVDSLLIENCDEVKKISLKLGAQGVIASIPVVIREGGIQHYNYKTGEVSALNNKIQCLIKEKYISEILLTDVDNEGKDKSFNSEIVNLAPELLASELKTPMIVFGGVSCTEQHEYLLEHEGISATAVGNFLNYQEHSVQCIKQLLSGIPIRSAIYSDTNGGWL